VRLARVGRIWLIGGVALLGAACQGGAGTARPSPETVARATIAAPATATPLPPARLPAPHPTATPTATPAQDSGWTLHEGPGFSVSLPEDWQVQAMDEAKAAALFESLRRTDPHLAGIVSSPEAIRASVLLAFAPPDGPGFTDNASIRRMPLSGQEVADLQGTVTAVRAELGKLGFSVLSAESDLRMADVPAARLISATSGRTAAGETVDLRTHQYLVATRDDLWILAYTTVADREETMRPVFEQSAATFRPE